MRAKGREGGNKGGRGSRGGREGRQPVAHDHRITSSYSTSSAPVHGRSRVKRGSSSSSSRSLKHISHLSFMCILMNASSKLTAAGELIQEHSEYFHFFISQDLFSRKGPSNSGTHFLSCKSHF